MIIKVLSEQEINRIHQSSLEILKRVGVIVPHGEILSLFSEIGAEVDFTKQRVKIPANIVMDLISKAGNKFTIYGRDLTKRAEFGVGKRNYNTSGGEALWIENIGDERRYSTLNDVANAVRFSDGLEQITIPGAMADPHEIPVEWRCVAVAFEAIKNTTKPITFWFYDRASTKYLMDLLITLRGDEKSAQQYPMFYPLLEPVSPLSFPFNGVDLLFETSRLNIPVPIGPMAQMGMSAPATIAGTLALENAEILAGICITQLVHEGTPVCYGGICHAFDMRTTQMIFSGPEQTIFSIAMTQMGKYYGFPIYINVGLTDSKMPDAQAGLECGLTLATGVAAGADIFGHMGICGVDQASSLDILVMQSEIISYVENTMRKIEFNDDTFAIDVIEKVGPKGSFIDNIHTVRHFRKEMWFPTLLDRNYYDTWRKMGCSSMEKRCRKKKEDLLATHKPEPIASDLAKELKNIVESAKRDLSTST